MTALAHTIIEVEEGHTITETDIGHTVVDHEESTVVQVTELVLPDQGYITSDTLDTAVVLTQAEYNLLTPVPTTLYVIIG